MFKAVCLKISLHEDKSASEILQEIFLFCVFRKKCYFKVIKNYETVKTVVKCNKIPPLLGWANFAPPPPPLTFIFFYIFF